MTINTINTVVTPAFAQELLSRNINNRRCQPSRVNQIANAMCLGLWQNNGESVIVASSGVLLDGQHRLAAVVMSGVSVPMTVVSGVHEDAFQTIDSGRTRMSSDVLGITGVKNPKTVGGAAALLWRMFHGLYLPEPCTSNYVLRIVERYPEIEEFSANKTHSAILPPSVLAVALLYLNNIAKKPELAGAFWEGITKGANLSSTSPLLALRSRMINLRSSGNPLHTRSVWNATVRTVSALEAGERLTRVFATPLVGPVVAPDMFPEHVRWLTNEQRLVDLVPPPPMVKAEK